MAQRKEQRPEDSDFSFQMVYIGPIGALYDSFIVVEDQDKKKNRKRERIEQHILRLEEKERVEFERRKKAAEEAGQSLQEETKVPLAKKQVV